MYARSGFGSMLTPAVQNIILINVAIFLALNIAYNLNIGYLNLLLNLFSLRPYAIIDYLFVWQVFSYMFMHFDFWHIAFNMFAVFIFGGELEREWGSKEFYRYYLATGLAAGVAIFLWNLGLGMGNVPTIGASGAVFGILAAYALFFPDRYILLSFLFPIKAKYLVVIYGLIEFFSLPSQGNISHIGHLGGLIAGYFYIRHKYARYGIGRNFFRDFFRSDGRGF